MAQADRRASRRPTLNDVARRARVSRQTVSNAINAPHKLQPSTRRRVDDAIARLGYQANWAARSLRARNSRMIGYQVAPAEPGAVNSILDPFLHALTEAARDVGYLVVLFTSHDIAEAERTYEELARRGAVDGFVLSGTGYGDKRAEWLLGRSVPFVTFGRTEFGDDHPWVDVDNTAGVRTAVEHLVAAGHRRIAFVGWPAGSAVGDQRLEGYRDAMAAAGLVVSRGDVVRELENFDAGRRVGGRLLDRSRPPTAIVATSDILAAGCLAAARARGLAVGSELAVIGYDDSPLAAFLSPPLSTVRQPVEDVAREIARILTTTLAGGDPSPRHVLLPPTLIRRASG